eukprot:TRINITY_DN6209_c0_g1_i1.p1 TRINITY_DN6209_c0_g1~~TRINITY_DN6209_c0_g1_i1.p1  ORF type:complete len:563 (+),score=127.06 TRINITY_DN6209_c0_g1_i1:542-2230(+)
MGNCCGSSLPPEARQEPVNGRPQVPQSKEDDRVAKETEPAKGVIIRVNPFPEMVNVDVLDVYEVGRELGRGEFGVTSLVTDKVTGMHFACKSIPKRKLRTAIDAEDVRREVAIMHHLPKHPNIVGLRAVYEDRVAVHIVEDLCEGGELFERIIARGHYSERAAAGVARTIVEVVEVCHKHGVMHRDLKPENFLFANPQENSPLRAIDFGLSVMFQPGEVFQEIVGSPYYMAPEVLRRAYGPPADVWSAGVILYILLCGVPPFWAETEQGVAHQVLRAKVDFRRDPWPKVSDAAKELVKAMLNADPLRRPTAEAVLKHRWIENATEAPDTPLGADVLSRIRDFSQMNQLKKKALLIIAEQLLEDEVKGLQAMFRAIDTDNSGAISLEEFRVGLRKSGTQMTEHEVERLLAAADLNNDGLIDYQEFVAATMHMQKVDHERHLRTAFDTFDTDGSGQLDVEELSQALGVKGDSTDLLTIINECDENNDGQISFDEFQKMMRKGSEWRSSIRLFSKERPYLAAIAAEVDAERAAAEAEGRGDEWDNEEADGTANVQVYNAGSAHNY